MHSKLICVVCLLGLLGCVSARVPEPLTQTLSGNDAHSVSEFWHQLAVRPMTSNDEAFHALLIFTDGKDSSGDYSGRIKTLKSRDMLPANFNEPADQTIDRGTLAVALVKVLNLRGGVTMSVFGAMPRYASRLLQHEGIYPDGSPNQTFSGAQFIGIMGKIEDYQRGGMVNLPASMLPKDVASGSLTWGQGLDAAFVGEALALANTPDLTTSAVADSLSDLFPDHPLLLFADAQPLLLDVPATVPATGTVAPIIIIDDIEGEFVEVRKAGTEQFEPARIGMKLGTDAELRTGPHCAIRFIVPPDQTGSLDRSGTVKISELLKETTLVTDAQLMYGRFRYDQERIPGRIEESVPQHNTSIRSPNSTLAIRGTRVGLYDQPPFIPEAVSLVGTAEFINARRQLIAFGTRTAITNRIKATESSPTETALAESYVDPSIARARTPEDAALLASLISRGSIVTFDRGSGLNIVRGGIPPTFEEISRVLPGQLSFVLRWTTDANLDLGIINQAGGSGEFLFPASGLSSTRSGGRIAFDHQGGPNGGIEVAYWRNNFPAGFYTIAINHTSGGTATAEVEVFRNRQQQQIFDPSANGGAGGLVSTYSATVSSSSPTEAVLFNPDGVYPTGAAPLRTASLRTRRR